MRTNRTDRSEYVAISLIVICIVWAFSAWLTHVIICIKASAWGLLIAGAIFFPVGIIHGTGHWFGAW